MSSAPPNTITVQSIENYTFGVKEGQQQDRNFHRARLERLKQAFESSGMGRAVEIVLLVHLHNHPHVLLLKHQDAFLLPGGALNLGETEEEGIARILRESLSAEADCAVKGVLSTWWRPNFETFTYPYCPPHVSRPKEQIRICLVELPQTATFSVSKDLTLMAVPLFEIFENSTIFGPLIAGLPTLLGRFNIVTVPALPDIDSLHPNAN